MQRTAMQAMQMQMQAIQRLNPAPFQQPAGNTLLYALPQQQTVGPSLQPETGDEISNMQRQLLAERQEVERWRKEMGEKEASLLRQEAAIRQKQCRFLPWRSGGSAAPPAVTTAAESVEGKKGAFH